MVIWCCPAPWVEFCTVWRSDRPKAAISRFCPGSCILPATFQSLCRYTDVSFLTVMGQDIFIWKPWISVKRKCTPDHSLRGIIYFPDKPTVFPDSIVMSTISFILWDIPVRVSVVTKVHGHKGKEADSWGSLQTSACRSLVSRTVLLWCCSPPAGLSLSFPAPTARHVELSKSTSWT